MSKNKFNLPIITFTIEGGGDETVIGGGSLQGGSGTSASQMAYSAWLASEYADDIILDDVINEYDYAAWWLANNWGQSDWERLNPGLPWADYFD